MFDFSYPLDDFPLHITDDGFEGGAVNGTAIIEYDSSGSWKIGSISISVSRYNNQTFKYDSKDIMLKQDDIVFSNISHILNCHKAQEINQLIGEKLEENGYPNPFFGKEDRLTAFDLGVGRAA